jgi:hypothetical protein
VVAAWARLVWVSPAEADEAWDAAGVTDPSCEAEVAVVAW